MDPLARAPRQPSSPRVFYGWYIAAAGALTNFLVIGVTVFGFQVFYQPMHDELGWSMTAILAGVSVRSFEQGFLSPVTGFLVDRLGPRRMAIAGVTVLAIGLLMFSQARELWFYYAASLVIALGQSLGAFTPFSLSLMNWFQKKRGRAMGLMNAGNGFGSFAVPFLVALIGLAGWRGALAIAAGVIFFAGVPLGMVVRLRPEPYGYRPDGEPLEAEAPAAAKSGPEERPAPAAATGLSVAEALRTPAFFLLALVSAVTGSTQTIWNSVQLPHLLNVGFTLETAGFFVAVYGAVQVVLRVSMGWAGDIFGRRRLFMLSFVLQTIGFASFAMLTTSRLWLIPVFYLSYAIGHASMVVLSQTVVADYFGTMRYATLRGLSTTLAMPAGVTAPIIAGWIFDNTGSYQWAFLLNAAIVSTGIIWLALIRRPPWSDLQSKRAEELVGAAGAVPAREKATPPS